MSGAYEQGPSLIIEDDSNGPGIEVWRHTGGMVVILVDGRQIHIHRSDAAVLAAWLLKTDSAEGESHE